MDVQFTSRFTRAYRKLGKHQRGSVNEALSLFMENPFAPHLRNHALKGEYEGTRSISAAYDLRILYVEEGNHRRVFLVTVGKHDDVY